VTDNEIAMLKTGLDLLRSAIEAIRSGLQLYHEAKRDNDEEKIEIAQERIVAAERDISLAEAQLAVQLGYRLCRCTFPPQIMTKVGIQLRGDGPEYEEVDVHRCPACRAHDAQGGYLRTGNRRVFVVIP
jgi:hypothetical protein